MGKRDFNKVFLKITGYISALLGLIVMFGWFAESSFIIQIRHDFAPMQFNTALGFFLIGLALVTFCLGYRNISAVLGSAVSLLGFFTLAQYMFNIDLGIDQLFLDHYISIKSSHPGRMAPNTAVSFLFAGLFFITNVLNIRLSLKEIMRALIGSILFSISIVAFFGYVFDIQSAYGWQKHTQMAFHTAIGFLTLSIGVLSRLFFIKDISAKKYWVSIPLSFSVLLISILFSHSVYQQETLFIQDNIDHESESVIKEMKLNLKEHENALSRMAHRQAYYKSLTKEDWLIDAQHYFEDLKGSLGIRYADKNHIIKWIYPTEKNKQIIGYNLQTEDNFKEAINKSIKLNKAVPSDTIDLFQGEKGFLLFAPIINKDEFLGHMIIVYKLDTLFKNFINNDNFYISIFENEKNIYENEKNFKNNSDDYSYNADFSEIGYNWAMKVTPKKTYIRNLRTDIPVLILFFGLIVSALFGSCLYYLTLNMEQNRKLLEKDESLIEMTDTQKKLQKEIYQKEELMLAQSRQAAMGDMIAMIAHQWRQPITVVAMASNNLQIDLELESEITSERLHDLTRIITEQTQHLSETINDFKNFFQPNKAKEEILVQSVITNTMKIIGKNLENHNIKVEISNNSEKKICTYPNELLQVFLNIINNAKDALLNENIENSLITITVTEDINSVKTAICDNAGGIPKSVIKRIGEPYFTTKDKNGTGLGVYMSKIIVEKHLNGKLTWKNKRNPQGIGLGACFTISLPIVNEVMEKQIVTKM